MKQNFTVSSAWNNSILLRYPMNQVKKIDNIYFYEENSRLICQHFFNFNINNEILVNLENEVNKNKKIVFKYIDTSDLFETLKNWSREFNFYCQIIDSWQAPRLVLDDSINLYLSNNKHTQIKRNYKYYKQNKEKFRFYNSDNNDILTLWNWVLTIDYNSWKQREKSDMKSLNREDLQYLPFMLENKECISLIVICDEKDNPLAYSLMFKNYDNYWYAVKWGASDLGRKLYCGFFCLFNHLEYIEQIDGIVKIDFWGRRNKTYDELSNNYVIRNHLEISKGSDKIVC